MTDPTVAYLRTLGEPRLENADGSEADIPLGKPFALLVYLLLCQDPPSRDKLARIFWPDSPRERARASVRQALWLLRNTLGEDLFVSDDPVQIRAGAVRTDVGDLRRALARDDMDRAYALWEGPPLESVKLLEVPEWERWLETLGGELVQRLADGAGLLGNRHRETGDLAGAITWLQRAREIQPYRLQHHLDLAETCLESRRFDEAADTLLEARRHLVDEQDLEAVSELEERLQTIRRGSLGDPLQDPSLRLDFVGRSEEFAGLVRRWRQTRSGRAGVGVVTGEAGIGKSRLAGEVALLARTEGGRTVHVHAADGERPIEWGLLGELVQELMSLSGAAGISHASDGMLRALLPSLSLDAPARSDAPSNANGEASADARPSAALSDALHDLVTAVSEDAPLLIVVEDLHWADAESRAILARVAAHLEAVPVFLLVTSRHCGGDARVEKTVSLLCSLPHATTVELSPWDLAEIEAVFGQLAELSHTPEEHALIARVARMSRGVPRFVAEVVQGLQKSGVLEGVEAGEGRFHPERLDGDPPLPPAFRLWIREELPNLSQHALAVALAIARAGTPLRPVRIAEATESSPEQVGRGIGELLELRLATWHEEDQVALVHRELAAAFIRHQDATAKAVAARSAPLWWAWAAILAGLVFVGLASTGYVFGESEGTPPQRLGGGSLVVVGPDSTLTLDGYGGAEPRWEAAALASWFPEGQNIVGPFRTTSGELHWFENRYAAGSPSWIVDLGSDGSDTAVVRQARAERFLTLSPSGRFYLSVSPHREFPETRDEVRISVRRRGASWPVYRADGKIRTGEWSVDARAVALGVRGPEGDEVVILGITGGVLERRPFDQVLNTSWCGGSRELIVAASEGEVSQLFSWDLETDMLEPLLSKELLGTALTCAPDGSAVVFQTASEGLPRYGYLDRQSGRVSYLPLADGAVVEQLRWVPDRIDASPIYVAIHEGESLTMQWGDRVDLGADLVLSDWVRTEGDVEWSTSDPEVASVSPDGELTANTAGTAVITAGYGEWLRDRIEVTVEGEPTPGTLFSSTLGSLDRGDWLSVGVPQAQPTRRDGRSVLEFRGDGDESTGVISTQSFALPRGGTVEVDFLLPGLDDPTNAPMSAELCLLDAEPPPTTGAGDSLEADSFRSWNVRQRVCFAYPYGPVPRVDPAAAGLVSHDEFPPVRADLAGHLPTSDWFHVTIFLRSDGTARFLVNDELVGTTPVQVRNTESVRWRVGVFGSGGDRMQPMVRDLSLAAGWIRSKGRSARASENTQED